MVMLKVLCLFLVVVVVAGADTKAPDTKAPDVGSIPKAAEKAAGSLPGAPANAGGKGAQKGGSPVSGYASKGQKLVKDGMKGMETVGEDIMGFMNR